MNNQKLAELERRVREAEKLAEEATRRLAAVEHKAAVNGYCGNPVNGIQHTWSGPAWARYCFFCEVRQ